MPDTEVIVTEGFRYTHRIYARRPIVIVIDPDRWRMWASSLHGISDDIKRIVREIRERVCDAN